MALSINGCATITTVHLQNYFFLFFRTVFFFLIGELSPITLGLFVWIVQSEMVCWKVSEKVGKHQII